jgi:putative ABC transport system permease protein
MTRLLFNLNLAYRAIRGNRLRSAITIAIIALGITALIGILTSIEVMKAGVYSSFSAMGSNSFQITGDIIKQKKGKGGLHFSRREGKNISYMEARAFKERFSFPSDISMSMSGSGTATVKYASVKTNPNINTMGIDDKYLVISDTKLEAGRGFSQTELEFGSTVCILGYGVAKTLFGAGFTNVVGIAEEKGGSMMMNADNIVFVPLENARRVYGTGEESFVLNVMVKDVSQKELAAQEAEGLFRVIRKVPVGMESDFTIQQNDSLATMLLESISIISIAALFIGMITLLGSVIGLMNIMLVSVAERTREIGINKALGARASSIKQQFLTESILISLIGGVTGIILGILIGNIFSLIFKTPFIVPWGWAIMGMTLCTVVGVVSGIYPALKASRLDPIVALRYE